MHNKIRPCEYLREAPLESSMPIPGPKAQRSEATQPRSGPRERPGRSVCSRAHPLYQEVMCHLNSPGLAQSLAGSLLLSPGSWCTQGFVCVPSTPLSWQTGENLLVPLEGPPSPLACPPLLLARLGGAHAPLPCPQGVCLSLPPPSDCELLKVEQDRAISEASLGRGPEPVNVTLVKEMNKRMIQLRGKQGLEWGRGV